jgi:hypothetical protein
VAASTLAALSFAPSDAAFAQLAASSGQGDPVASPPDPDRVLPVHAPGRPPSAPAKASTGPAKPAYWLDFGLRSGLVDYQENVSIEPTVSSWRSGFVGLDATVHYRKDRLRANVSGGLWRSSDAEEQWRIVGLLGQRNDMEVYGLDWLAEVGYDLDLQEEVSITSFIGLGYRFQEFSRSNFDLFRVESEYVGRINESFDIFLVQAALEMENRLSATSLLQLRADLGHIFSNGAINTAIPGSLDGDGGFIFRASCQWTLQIKPNQSFLLGVYYDHQENLGTVAVRSTSAGEDYIVEWPDNDLERMGIRVAFGIDL